MVLFKDLDLPLAWRPLFQGLSRMGYDLEAELDDVLPWASRPCLLFRDAAGTGLYLSFMAHPLWCGNAHQEKGITVVGLSRSLPATREEAEAHSLSLVMNWQQELEDFLDFSFPGRNL